MRPPRIVEVARNLAEAGANATEIARRLAVPRSTVGDWLSGSVAHVVCRACEQLGVRWTRSGKYVIYISRKADVAFLDKFIGPQR